MRDHCPQQLLSMRMLHTFPLCKNHCSRLFCLNRRFLFEQKKLLWLVKQHARRQVIERLERETVDEDDQEARDDDDASTQGSLTGDNSFRACDMGIRYPMFQSAIRRDRLHMRLKVRLYCCYTLIHTITHSNVRCRSLAHILQVKHFFV